MQKSYDRLIKFKLVAMKTKAKSVGVKPGPNKYRHLNQPCCFCKKEFRSDNLTRHVAYCATKSRCSICQKR